MFQPDVILILGVPSSRHMGTDEIGFAGIAELARLICGGHVSSVDLVDSLLERMERVDPVLNAFQMAGSGRRPHPAGRRSWHGSRHAAVRSQHDTGAGAHVTDCRPEVVAAVNRVAEVLTEFGHVVVERTPDYYGSVGNEIAPVLLRGIREHHDQVSHPDRLT